MTHTLSIHGCDDSTEFRIECTDEQLEFLEYLVELSTKTSTYGCMPTLEIDSKYAINRLKENK